MHTTSQPLDPAAVFAVAHSLWAACETHAGREPRTNLSECYNGMDQLMREVMRIAECFEAWACEHIAFDALNDVWPYLLKDRFGDACLSVLSLECLADFEEQDCLRVAMHLRLPIKCDGSLPLPVDLRARNTVPDSAFVELRIQSMRPYLETGEVFPYVDADEPYDEQFGAVSFALSGMESEDRQASIATLPTFDAAVSLATKLAPGIAFPSSFVFFHCSTSLIRCTPAFNGCVPCFTGCTGSLNGCGASLNGYTGTLNGCTEGANGWFYRFNG